MEFMCYSTNMMAYVWSRTEYSILFWSLQIVITWINSWNLQSRQVIAMYATLLILLSFCLIFFFQIERGIEWNKKHVAIFSYLIYWRGNAPNFQFIVLSEGFDYELSHYCIIAVLGHPYLAQRTLITSAFHILSILENCSVYLNRTAVFLLGKLKSVWSP